MKKAMKYILSTLLLYSSFSLAGIQIQATRVIINADMPKSLKIANLDPNPAMVQLWLDEKNDSLTYKENLPFVIQPPIGKISGKKTKVFRIIPLPEAKQRYPSDRESLIWFNALEIPGEVSEKSDDNSAKLKLAFRMRLKMFYRPAGLKGSPIEAGQKLKWRVDKTSSGYNVIAKNDSPFHVSFTRVWLKDDENKPEIKGGMVKPYSEQTFKIDSSLTNIQTVNYKFITDIGAIVHHKYKI